MKKTLKTPHEKKVEAKATKPATARHGKLGSILGHSIVSVIRAMGKAGWDYDAASAALLKAGVEAADHTIRVGLKRGRDGQKKIAPLTAAELNTLRVKKATKGKTSVAA